MWWRLSAARFLYMSMAASGMAAMCSKLLPWAQTLCGSVDLSCVRLCASRALLKLTSSLVGGLAYKGQAGVELCLRLLADEIKLCMALAGVTKVSEINRDFLVRVDASGFVHRLSKL